MSSVRRILEIKGSNIWSVSQNSTVYEALRLMATKKVGSLLVMEGEDLLGILSERDYARKVALQGKNEKETLVKEIMTANVITIHPEQTIQEAMEIMDKQHIRHLPVVLEEKVIGVISQRDAIRELIYQHASKMREVTDRLQKNGSTD